MMLVVYSIDAPDGACTIVMKYPSSSAGTNAPGTARYTSHVATSDTTKTPAIAHFHMRERRTPRTYHAVLVSITLLTPVKNLPCVWLSLSSSNAASAGVNVMALNTDRITAKVIVMANC